MGSGFRIEALASDQHAEIYIYEDVGAGFFGGVTAKEFARELKAAGKVRTIDVRINSGGGDVFDGLAIYNLLREHEARKTVHVDGLAASIASVIAMAGDEIRIADSAFLMIHNAWGMMMGDADEARKFASLLDQTTAAIADVYAARTGQPLDQLRQLMADETWMASEQAIEMGFADSIVTNYRVAASVAPRIDLSRFRAPPAPVKSSTARPLYNQHRIRLDRIMAERLLRNPKAIRAL